MTGPQADFLTAAAEAGLLARIGSWTYVADEYVDEANGEKQFLIEYADPGLVADGSALASLLAGLRVEHPEVGSALMRVAGDQAAPDDWSPYLTYIRFRGPDTDAPGELPAGVQIGGPEHRSAVHGWLVRALETGINEQQRAISAERTEQAATALMERDDRVSYVFVRDGRPIGHATLFDAFDDVTGRAFVELFDVLIEPDAERGPIQRSLVKSAVVHAVAAAKPLIGHVVHPVGEAGAGHATGVLARLLDAGWVVDHRYWRHPLTGDRSS